MAQTDEEIFSAAILAGDAAAQRRLVEGVCGQNELQFHRVIRLLNSYRDLQENPYLSILDRAPEVHRRFSLPAATEPVAEIGPYRITDVLGEGGMGLVYRAERNDSICRRVAIKVLKPGLDTRKVLNRFELERMALASMDHPGITRIFDAGVTESGRPYFVMELVDGLAITDYCQAKQISFLERIRLINAVCRAVSHAHQRGIIHRDIKPNNVLVAEVDGTRQPKVIDFGIAKVINPSFPQVEKSTNHGEMLGTPAYMSPEQSQPANAEVDVRTDVYSIGVLLYELLTGQPPVPLQGVQGTVNRSLRKWIGGASILLPSAQVEKLGASFVDHFPWQVDYRKLKRFLQGDVDHIVMKAIAADRRDRYQSVDDLQRDLERFLTGRPIEANPAGVFLKFSKLVRRHMALSALIGTAMIILTTAAVATSWFGWQAFEAQQMAQARLEAVLNMREQMKVERDRAIEAERRSRLLAQSFLLSSAVEQAMGKFFESHLPQLKSVNPKLQTLEEGGGLHIKSAEVLMTLFDSNLMPGHNRMTIVDNSKWLLHLAAGSLKPNSQEMYPISQATLQAVNTNFIAWTEKDKQILTVPAQDFPRTQLEDQVLEASSFAWRSEHTESRQFKFSLQDRLDYQLIYRDIVAGMHSDFPSVADAEDNIGLLQLDLNAPEKAIQHFEASIRVRRKYPEQAFLAMQSQLFRAECLQRLGRIGEAHAAINVVRNQLDAVNLKEPGENRKLLTKLADELSTRTTTKRE